MNLGITRKDVVEFLQNQESYQLTKNITKKTTNKPILPKYSNQIWSTDLIDVENYNGFNKKRKYILTVIDNFSRFVFAQGLVNKEPKSIIKAFENIHKISKVYPTKIISDNGSEFVNQSH